MNSVGTGTSTETGFGLSGRDARVIGGATGLLLVTIAVMYVLAMTPLAALNRQLFAAPIVGVLVYGVAIGGGEYVAERGVERGNLGIAALGTAILILAFGTFGAGVLAIAPLDLRVEILAITALVTAVLTALIAAYVYGRAKSFAAWGTYATYAFLGGIGAIAIGTFVLSQLLLVGFVLLFLGFLLRLGWEIWRVRENAVASATIQAIGVYVAIAGVFVHVLQLVLRYVLSRE
ncbi:hypothetical protein Halru_0570 [Halovivax ruber XH-70]|uniref:FtsH-interacting integral membrane protein n=1 Tax=Halovivax ruber (strain DSM 18193 / JCM 13892 / XH-70) TaxID=797302 RepID=L0I8R7_HALRX|nr:hypothetical protein [Halovivax ruber]AGB15203.1 hypothetical protein Halru_0570 [Halovivax ruber XH-70]